MALKIRPANETKYDILSLGEVMLRLDPGFGRIHTARNFQVWEGGGEYNVARGLRRCFGKRAAVVTAFADNQVGRLLEDLILQGGVNMEYVKWMNYDGIGRNVRNGLNFTEKGYGLRGAVGCSDRGITAASQLKPGDIDWEKIFGKDGVRWFHTGGIYAGLSESTSQVVIEAVQIAKKYGTKISYDLNYRPSIWKAIGGQAKAQEINKKIAPYIDVMIGNEEDFSACLGFHIEGTETGLGELDTSAFRKMINEAVKTYPNFAGVATTLRNAKTATINDWGALLWHEGKFYESIHRPDLEIYDRVGGGDSFASGLIYGLLEGKTPDEAVNYGAAHGALAMTTPGDTSMATLSEVEKAMKSSGARVDR
jgi:2-dehydro-3-deoxygluconokinase